VVLLLDESDARTALSLPDAIEAIGAAYSERSRGVAVEGERASMRTPSGWTRIMGAALPEAGVMGYKEFHLTKQGKAATVRYCVVLQDYATGELLLIGDGAFLTAARTAATAALAAKSAAAETGGPVGIIGSGSEARMQLRAMACVWDVDRCRVFSPNPKRREAFSAELSKELGLEIAPAGSAAEAVEEASLVIVATNTAGAGPALWAQDLSSFTHISSIGSTMPTQRELDVSVWGTVDTVIIDTPDVLKESGDAIEAQRAGTLGHQRVVELHDVIGWRKGNAPERLRTLYKSIGSPLQDVAVAWQAWQGARERGVGTEIVDFQSARQVVPN
jgi:alanine dehydrogenase